MSEKYCGVVGMKKQNGIHTFSIVAFDPETGELGVAVASKFLGVGSVVPWAKAGVGAVATQSWANPVYGMKGLELMDEGKTAEETMEILLKEDEEREVRQAGFVDAKGNSATFTGSACYSWAGGITGPNFACQGNILTGPDVVQKMAETFQNSTGDLANRLVKALKAGDEAGGDSRGKQSAALLVVKEKGGYGGITDRYIDLRVDDHQEPVVELSRLLKLHELYFKEPEKEDILLMTDELKEQIKGYLQRLEFLKDENVTDKEIFEAIHSFHLIENFDERIQKKGFIDKRVFEYMRDLANNRK